VCDCVCDCVFKCVRLPVVERVDVQCVFACRTRLETSDMNIHVCLFRCAHVVGVYHRFPLKCIIAVLFKLIELH